LAELGRLTARILLTKFAERVEIVAVNDITSPENLAYLLQYDTTYHKFQKEVRIENGNLNIAGQIVKVFAEREPAKLPWGELNIDLVLECTGRFLTQELASGHLQAGAKKVVLSAPAKDTSIPTFVQGVNIPSIYSGQDSNFFDSIVSNASCTTNCIAPALKVLSSEFNLIQANAITVHAYTATQLLQDGPSQKDFRDGRAASANMIPSKTGAAKAVELVIPELKGKLSLSSLRVPVITGSMVYLVATFDREISREEIQAKLEAASTNYLKNILHVSNDELVSSDIIASSYSSIVDAKLIETLGNTAKLVLWYDNEWGYANRLAELCV
jgi:glyceraldehyde 3-phosphate dehydrogenase